MCGASSSRCSATTCGPRRSIPPTRSAPRRGGPPAGRWPRGRAPPVLDALELAVDRIQQAGIALDAALGDIQWTDRNGVRVPVHGGSGAEGVTNVVGPGDNDTTSEPDIEQPERLFDGSSLTTEGYPIGFGTSFVYVLEFTPEGPRARALLSYGESGDPASPFFSDQTVRFSDKNWRPVEFTEDQIMSDPALVSYEVTGS
ncbi:MAG: penicillin acylase family protein [Acidimicrobiales bacterium]